MVDKETKIVFHLNAIIEGRLITGFVTFSPAPDAGIFTELARFEAERILEHMVREQIISGEL